MFISYLLLIFRREHIIKQITSSLNCLPQSQFHANNYAFLYNVVLSSQVIVAANELVILPARHTDFLLIDLIQFTSASTLFRFSRHCR